jgi:hypothetical protein
MTGHVGIFWVVDNMLICVSRTLDEADSYGDCQTYELGHSEQWDLWQTENEVWLIANNIPTAVLESQYDDFPRGRVVKTPDSFVIYGDRRLLFAKNVEAIRIKFHLTQSVVEIKPDSHYRKTANWS